MPHFADGSSASQNGIAIYTKKSSTASDGEPRAKRIRVKNRRKRYLDLHPEYFHGSNLELADPLLYDRLIRRFMTTEEREREGREQGYTGSMEADLVRSEAKMEALQHPDPNSPMVYRRGADGSIIGVEQDADERAQTKEDGSERWKDVMGQRFMRGGDKDFEYATVDDNDEYDDRDEEARSSLDEYLNAEPEEYLGEGKPTCETGIQDF